MSGYCTVCGELCAMQPGPTKPDSRQRIYFPFPHRGCNGHLVAIDDKPEKLPVLTPAVKNSADDENLS